VNTAGEETKPNHLKINGLVGPCKGNQRGTKPKPSQAKTAGEETKPNHLKIKGLVGAL
jgi:hypothetical protein